MFLLVMNFPNGLGACVWRAVCLTDNSRTKVQALCQFTKTKIAVNVNMNIYCHLSINIKTAVHTITSTGDRIKKTFLLYSKIS